MAFDDRYFLIERLHGVRAARLTAESHTAAIDEIDRIVLEEGIACDFEHVDGYLFARPGESQHDLEHEYEACRRAGIENVVWRDRAPLEGFDTGRCLCFTGQAQFHPLKYLAGLAQATVRRHGRIFTGTHATSIEPGRHGTSARIETANGHRVTAREVVVATNSPVQSLITLPLKQYPYRTYVIAARLPAGAVTPALFWDTGHPYHYVRVHSAADHDLLIVGGEDHRTGQADDGHSRYEHLAVWAKRRFPRMGIVEYAWSGQVMEPVDSLAFLGRYKGDENVWIATGDSGNGMTHGAIAGILIPELIAGHDHAWARLYDPARKSLRSGLEFTRENLNAAAQYASWLTPGDVHDADDIPPGSGAVLREGLRKVACYRDADGVLHRLDATCPHLGAIVRWNAEESTWDCPAHGSRFTATGQVVNGPANSDLQQIEERRPLEPPPAGRDEGIPAP
jgi:glycine/D-amino acid oxidase-like deaminating enzyme/nitrite reductase/ring-hydroxylating ferredoxin subunit